MEVKLTHPGKMRFRVEARSHVIESDQPLEAGGEDKGMTPLELLLASLASCAGFYASQYLSSRKLADHGVEVVVTAEKLKDPPRLGNFVIKVKSPVSLTEDQRVGMERSVHRCTIHQTLINTPKIDIELE
jgi:uncharacterized OsmC-like protein